MRTRISVFILLALSAAPAAAHPVPFKGALSVMTWNQPFYNETMTTFSFARRAAVAGQYMRMDMSDGEMKAYLPQLNLLAKRWNELESQANVYVVGGWGGYEFKPAAHGTTAAVGETRQRTAALAGIETDWESRKYYVSAKVTGLFPSFDHNTYVQTYRAGVSVYPAEFDEISSWFILDFQHINRRDRQLTVTPVLRMFYRNMLAEVGASFSGDYMLNFMVHL